MEGDTIIVIIIILFNHHKVASLKNTAAKVF